MHVTLTQASNMTGKSRETLLTHAKKGLYDAKKAPSYNGKVCTWMVDIDMVRESAKLNMNQVMAMNKAYKMHKTPEEFYRVYNQEVRRSEKRNMEGKT